jgi:hypothetical protein
MADDIAKHLASIFRHLLPGVLVVGAVGFAFPEQFVRVRLGDTHHQILLAVIALTIGNVWFALNRYFFHQLIDYTFYRCGFNGPAHVAGEPIDFIEDVAKYTRDSLLSPEKGEHDQYMHVKQHVKFRASTVLLIFTLGELMILVGSIHSYKSPLFSAPTYAKVLLILGGVFMIIVGIVQMAITRRIDFYSVDRGNKKSAPLDESRV